MRATNPLLVTVSVTSVLVTPGSSVPKSTAAGLTVKLTLPPQVLDTKDQPDWLHW